MTEAASTPAAVPPKSSAVLPFHDRSRKRRLVKVVSWLLGIALALLVLNLLGVDVRGWLDSVWDALTEISLGYLVAGWAVQTVQTTLTALAWFYILQAAYPDGGTRYRDILAAYAAGTGQSAGRTRGAGPRGQRSDIFPVPKRWD